MLPTVRVIARVRPSLKPESSTPSVNLLSPCALEVVQIEKNTLKRSAVPGEPPSQVIYQSTQPFDFDRVWWKDADTTTLHAHEVEPLVSAVLRGEGVTSLVLAYGQVGLSRILHVQSAHVLRHAPFLADCEWENVYVDRWKGRTRYLTDRC